MIWFCAMDIAGRYRSNFPNDLGNIAEALLQIRIVTSGTCAVADRTAWETDSDWRGNEITRWAEGKGTTNLSETFLSCDMNDQLASSKCANVGITNIVWIFSHFLIVILHIWLFFRRNWRFQKRRKVVSHGDQSARWVWIQTYDGYSPCEISFLHFFRFIYPFFGNTFLKTHLCCLFTKLP